MRHQKISVRAETTADPDAVYALLVDGATWPTWSPLGSFELEQAGPDGGEGVGAVRVFRTGRVTSRERVAELVPGRRFSYELLSGLPVRDYRADVDLARAAGGGTEIHWRSRFLPKVPGTGWLIRRRLTDFIGQCARGLAARAASARDAG
jgi:Polyketide cyclase / dehydrase and lipid transport